MEFAILGPLEVSVDGRPVAIPAGRQRAILALLLLNRNRVVTPDRILDAIWGEALPATGAKAIAYHVSCLRDALAPDRRQGRGSPSGLDTEAAGYVLRVDPEAIDAVRFEQLARQAHAQLADDPAAARAAADEALGLWRGEPLIDVAFADFAQGEIRRLDELRLGLLEDRLEADLLLGRHREAIGEAEALLRDHPLRDRVRGLLMLALHRSGRQAEALRISAEGRRLAAEELGIDPSPELVRIESWILTQDPRLDAPAPETAGPAPRNPFKGLRSFGEADHADFFGREGLVRHLLGRIEAVSRRHRLLVLVGPSGSGKSSVVRAGLVPALRAGAIDGSGRWRIATMAPGTSPFRELAGALRADGVSVADETIAAAEATGTLGPLVEAALAGGATHFLVVVDQLEELYTNVDDATRDRFIAALGDALDNPDRRMLAIATLRADLFDRPLRSPTFGERVRQGLEAVTPLRRDELERAIVRPAAAVGIAVEPGLAADIIADVESQPATLPLLQYALTELFDRREGRTLTRAGYAAIHGATGALARAAEEAWSTFDAAARDLARQLLLRLVVLGDDAEVSPRRAPRSELQSVAERDRAESVLAELERRRLVTFDRDPVSGEATVEIAHEALLTNWPRLATWVDELRQALWMRRRVDDAAGEWEASGRSPGFLATGARLDQFAAWLADARLRPTVAERAYIDASCGERTRLVRRGRRLRFTVAAVLLAAAVAATSLTATLVGERQAAAELQDITTARGLAAGVVASLGKDPELSVLLALQAANATVARGYVVEEAYDALHWALGEAGLAYPADAGPAAVRQGPDGPRGVFLLPPDDLMRAAAAYVGRSLFPEECMTYLHDTYCRAVEAPPPGSPPLRIWTSIGVVEAGSLAVPSLTGTHVRILSELRADLGPLLLDFAAVSGIVPDWDPAGADLASALEAGDAPDLAIVERPAVVQAAATSGALLPLNDFAGAASVAAAAGSYLTGLGSVEADGELQLYGVPIAAALDDLLWYPVDAFTRAGYEPPSTPAELAALVARIEADRRVPWCLGTQPDASTPAGTAVGPATMAWVGDLLLDREGPAAYDAWVTGSTPSYVEGAELAGGPRSAIQVAIESLNGLVDGRGAAYGGLAVAAWTPEALAALPMVADDVPRCWLLHGSSADRAILDGRPARVSAVPYPGAEPHGHPVLGRVFELVVLRDRPEVREAIRTLLGRPLATAMATELATDGILPVQPVAAPADPLAASELARLRAAIDVGLFRVRPTDLLPDPVVRSFSTVTAARLAGTTRPLGSWVLEIDMAWESLRRGAQ